MFAAASTVGTQSRYMGATAPPTNIIMAAKRGGAPTVGARALVDKAGKNIKPLSPGSNYPATKNIQIQKSGFGNFLQKFETLKPGGKSSYGVPIFTPNGNINPAYLAAERKALVDKKKQNIKTAEAKRKGLIAKKEFELADYVRKKIGNVGSGKEYYESGR